MRLIWDLETNGLLPTVSVIHSLLMLDVDNGTLYSCHDHPEWANPNPKAVTLSIDEGLKLLAEADERIGHNVIRYDLRVLEKLYPQLVLKGKDTDTLVLAKLFHPDIKAEDTASLQTGRLHKETFKHKGRPCYGSHSLAAWGHRLGVQKIEYEGPFDEWCPELQIYGEGDLDTTVALWRYLKPHTHSQDAIELEHRVAYICYLMERDGIPFDIEGAIELQATLVAHRDRLKRELVSLFPPWEIVVKEFEAKVSNKKLGRKKGDWVVVKKTVVFNPGSRDHIIKCFKEKYDWKPTAFTPAGKPQVDDEVLEALDYPEAKQLAEYFMVCKRLSQLAEGDENWMQYYENGLVHPQYNTIGTVTTRCSHFQFNIGQVPAVDKPYGPECRALFANAPQGYNLLGSDMSGLELRCLGHYLAFFDKGRYADIVINGDIHTINQQAAGLPTRNNAKTFIYGFLYGAGPEKVGSIIKGSAAVGRRLIKAFLAKTPGLTRLRNRVSDAVGKGYVVALDGRHIPIRKQHAALNSLLQSAGAIICKRWMVNVFDALQNKGLKYGEDFRFVAFIHDELQIMVKTGLEAIVGDTCKAEAERVGVIYNMKCPLAAEYKVGRNWAETH